MELYWITQEDKYTHFEEKQYDFLNDTTTLFIKDGNWRYKQVFSNQIIESEGKEYCEQIAIKELETELIG